MVCFWWPGVDKVVSLEIGPGTSMLDTSSKYKSRVAIVLLCCEMGDSDGSLSTSFARWSW
jgi:hypothetical protein